MNCQGHSAGEKILAAILADLDEARIRRQIDEPIEAVFREVNEKVDHLPESLSAHEVLARFVQRVYRDGLRSPWQVTDPNATVMTLLDSYYRGPQTEGYHGAVLDATGPAAGGMTFVLTRLAEIIRTQERQEYVEAVFTRRIDPSNWRLRCEIVEVLLERYRLWLPPQLLDCAVWQLVDEIPAIVLHLLGNCPAVVGVAKPPQNPPR